MNTNFYVDETKAKGYVVAAAASGALDQVKIARKAIDTLILPGQRSLHMKDENETRRRMLADTIVELAGFGFQAIIYDAGRIGTERDRRARCLQALVHDVGRHRSARIVLDLDESLLRWDRQRLIEYIRTAGLTDRVTYRHASRHQDCLLAIPDAIAWCWARGGEWRRRVKPIVTEVREL